MGSKLSVLAAQLIVVASVAGAHAQPAADHFKKGIDAYKAGKFDEAAASLEKAYQREPKPETLFALAQAERLAGHCEKAVPRYKQLLERTTELATAKAVQNNLALCPQPEPVAAPEPKVEPVASPPPSDEAAPAPATRTVVREVRRTDALGVTLLGAGALGAGVSVGFLLRSQAARDDAANARTLDAANALHDRADRDRLVAIVAGGASAAAIGFAIYRLASGGPTPETEVAVTPTAGGSMLVLSRPW